MIRVHVICEGQTEEMFVNQVLEEPLRSKGVYLIPSLIGRPGHKGGYFKYERLLIDLRERLLRDTSAYCTTFFDFYGLPDDFPGKAEAKEKVNTREKAECVIQHLNEKLLKELGEVPLKRFIPHIQMHEFEGLLFSDPSAMANAFYRDGLSSHFAKIRKNYDTPECINNSIRTAPSKRIKAVISDYDKVIHGSLAGIAIGLNTIRQECKIFNEWLEKIEKCGGDCIV